MIDEDAAEKAVNWIRDNAEVAAQAKANRIYLEEFRKVLKAKLMRQHPKESLGAQEAIAYADPEYEKHLKAMEIAIEKDEQMRWMMTAAEAKLEAWRTQSANARKA